MQGAGDKDGRAAGRPGVGEVSLAVFIDTRCDMLLLSPLLVLLLRMTIV